MTVVNCPSCGNAVYVPDKKSGLTWLIGCVVAIPIFVVVIGLLAAIAIPSFVRARQTSQMNACMNNMRYIDAAVEEWATSAAGQPLGVTSVNRYMQESLTAVCPAQGTYTYNIVAQDPECSVHGLLE